MVDLPNAKPSGPPMKLDRDEVVAILTGLAPGYYTSVALLPRANKWLESQGRSPVNAKTLGESIRRTLRLDRRKVRGNMSAWHVTPEAVAGRDWFATPRRSATVPEMPSHPVR